MFSKTKIIFYSLVTCLTIIGGFFVFQKNIAEAAINQQINFQGKVVNTDGTNVANGSYNFVFAIYSQQAPGGTVIWTESKSLTVTDGIFQTNLGDATALPGSVDFNTNNIFLGINFNSNGEMTPRVQFAAVPYAFNASKVAGLTVTDTTGTLTIPNAKTISFGGAFTTTPANDLVLTTSAATNVTLPTTGTLAALGNVNTWTGAQTFTTATATNDTLGFSISNTGAARFAGVFQNSDLTAARTYTLQDNSGVVALGTAANTLFFTTSAATSVTLPTTGTLAALNGVNTWTGAQTFTTATATNDTLGFSISNTGAARFAGVFQNLDLTAARTYTLQDNSGVVALGTAANNLFFTTSGATNVTLPTTGTLMTNPMTTVGDIIYGAAAGAATRLAGSAGFLTSTGAAAPVWTATSTDYFTQYALLDGRAAGQTLNGGNAANDDITINGTTNATKTTSYVLLQSTGGNVGIGNVAPAEALDVNGNIKIGSATTGVVRSTTELVMRQDGDTYGSSILRLRNRNGENGAIFETTDPTAALVDFIFKTSIAQRNIRMESRATAKTGINSFHIGGGTLGAADPDNPSLSVGDNYSAFRNKLAIGDATYALPTQTLAVTGDGLFTSNLGIGVAATDRLNVSQSTTATGIDGEQIALTTTGTTNNADNAGLRIDVTSGNTGTTTTLEGIMISNLVGAQVNSTETALKIGTGWDLGIAIASGGISISAGALAIDNATGITSNQATMIINAGGTVDIQDILNTDSISTDTGGVTIASAQSYTGAGAVTLSSGAAAGLTLDSASNTLTVAASDTSLMASGIGTLTLGANVSVTNASGNITFQPAGSGTTANVQIGAGGAGSTTPDLLVLDSKSTAGDPAATKGAMYFNANTNKFRCSQDGLVFADCVTGPAGTNTQVQFNDNGVFGADAGFSFDKTTQTFALNGTDSEIDLNGVTNEPAAPTAGDLRLYSKDIAGRMMPKWKAPSGFDTPFQAFLGFNGVRQVAPASGNAAATCMQAIGTAFTNVGNTIVQVTPTSGSVLNSTRRVTLATSAAAAGVAYHRANVLEVFRGDAAGRGGFFFSMRFNMSTLAATAANNRAFFGLVDTIANPTNIDPTTSTTNGKLGMAINTSTGNWNFVNNIAGTAPTVAPLGANFPINTTDLYELVIYSAPNGSSIGYRITNQSTGNTISGSVNTNIPNTTTFLAPVAWASNNVSNTQSVGFGLNKWYLESDF